MIEDKNYIKIIILNFHILFTTNLIAQDSIPQSTNVYDSVFVFTTLLYKNFPREYYPKKEIEIFIKELSLDSIWNFDTIEGKYEELIDDSSSDPLLYELLITNYKKFILIKREDPSNNHEFVLYTESTGDKLLTSFYNLIGYVSAKKIQIENHKFFKKQTKTLKESIQNSINPIFTEIDKKVKPPLNEISERVKRIEEALNLDSPIVLNSHIVGFQVFFNDTTEFSGGGISYSLVKNYGSEGEKFSNIYKFGILGDTRKETQNIALFAALGLGYKSIMLDAGPVFLYSFNRDKFNISAITCISLVFEKIAFSFSYSPHYGLGLGLNWIIKPNSNN